MTCSLHPRIFGLVMVAVAALGVGALPASPAAASCGITWGSFDKQSGQGPAAPPDYVVGARAGEQVCYDRLVFDLDRPAAGYRVRYVSQVTEDGSGRPVALQGGAFIQITLYASDTNITTGQPTYSGVLPSVIGFRTFRQVAHAGGFEGYTSFGLGVRARLPFRVFVLSGPGSGSRVVLDVAHTW